MSADAARVGEAVQWFESKGLDLIRVHYPTRLPASTNPLGVCSCRKPYKMDPETGKPVQTDGLCLSPGKHPADRDWNRGRKVAEGGWDAAWNVGLLCGPEHRALVLDVDVRNGGSDGWAALVKLVPWLEGSFSYWTSKAPSGERGFHVLLLPDDAGWAELKGSPASVMGVDVKDSGMVVTVPSQHATGDAYEFRRGDLPMLEVGADAGKQLAAALRELRQSEPASSDSETVTWKGGVSSSTPAPQLFRRWLLGYPIGSLDEGTRNDGMSAMVGAVIRMATDGWDGLTDKDLLVNELQDVIDDPTGVPPGVMHVVSGLNATLCSPPLPGEEIRSLVHNLYRNELEKRINELDGVTGGVVGMMQQAQDRTVSRIDRTDTNLERMYGFKL